MGINNQLKYMQSMIQTYNSVLNNDAIKSAAQMSKIASSMGVTSMTAALENYQKNMKDLFEPLNKQMHFSPQEYRDKIAESLNISIPSITSQIADLVSTYQEMFAKQFNMVSIQSLHKNFANYQLTPSIKKLASDMSDIYRKNFDFSGMKEVIERLKSFPNIDDIISDTEYTKEDVLSEAENAIQELDDGYYNVSNINPSGQEEIDAIKIKFWKSHPALYNVLHKLLSMILIPLLMDGAINTIPGMVETGIVALQGKSDVYYVNTDSSRIYEYPSCKSNVVTIVYYSEEVIEVEDARMWRKVMYEDTSGNIVVGWIAKRNLKSYKDVMFKDD